MRIPPDRLLRLLLAAWLAAAACAGPAGVAPPSPIQAEAKEPPLGRMLRLELRFAGEPLVLEAVVGRVTLLCVLGEEREPMIDACRSAQAEWGDRLAVVGLSTTSELPHGVAPFRVYTDPEGAELKSRLEIGPGSAAILTDRRGRVAAVLGPDRLEELDRTLDSLVG